MADKENMLVQGLSKPALYRRDSTLLANSIATYKLLVGDLAILDKQLQAVKFD